RPNGPPIRDGKPYSQLVHLAEDVRPFVAIGQALRERGFAAPEVLEQDLDAGLLLLEDLGEAGDTLAALEGQITTIWHRLLIRNADYARDAAFWQARAEPFQGYLARDSVLLAFVQLDADLVAFIATASHTEAVRLPGIVNTVQRLGRQVQFHLRAAPNPGDPHAAALAANAQKVLQRLYQLLIAPLAPLLAAYPRLQIVSAGPLHYLPFHALHSGESYLLEQHAVSYLPAASVLCYLRKDAPAGIKPLVLGHSAAGRLPNIPIEARAVADLFGCEAYLESQATLTNLRREAAGSSLIHLAAHGDFRADNPLFSGVSLADGRLTTLDAFGLELQAALVVLSACETGRNVVGGGDELIGLMRALLHAGASALLLSHWQVEDHATAELMRTFYRHLIGGAAKDTALQATQRTMIAGQSGHAHPYYWAPFFLVGDPAPLGVIRDQ
ncbi:MAG: CHAT domain-containing protein, partial [Oscillochloris sp.]|nr:CHAT domain-containing protein [Oscillochloris sp.]